jgi:hypothetical protein
MTQNFASWRDRWTKLGRYTRLNLPDRADRQQALVALWRSNIPAPWKRGTDAQLLGPRYRRKDWMNPRRGEHKIEHEILCEFFPEVVALGSWFSLRNKTLGVRYAAELAYSGNWEMSFERYPASTPLVAGNLDVRMGGYALRFLPRPDARARASIRTASRGDHRLRWQSRRCRQLSHAVA